MTKAARGTQLTNPSQEFVVQIQSHFLLFYSKLKATIHPTALLTEYLCTHSESLAFDEPTSCAARQTRRDSFCSALTTHCIALQLESRSHDQTQHSQAGPPGLRFVHLIRDATVNA